MRLVCAVVSGIVTPRLLYRNYVFCFPDPPGFFLCVTIMSVFRSSVYFEMSAKLRKLPGQGSKALDPPITSPSSRSSVLSVVTNDASLLMAASGICTMALSGLLSFAMVLFDEDLTSVTQLRLFSPSMVTGSVLLTIGVLNGMLEYLTRKTPGELVLPPGHPAISPNKLAEMEKFDENGNPIKRVSRCPMGF
ncbi:hypothetical protein Plhal304r1_c042g0122261 [Plasmopara halstedii]